MPEKVDCSMLRRVKKAWGFNGGDILRVGEPSYRVLGCVEKTSRKRQSFGPWAEVG